MSPGRKDYDSATTTMNHRGEWVPSIPLPLYEQWPLMPTRYRCSCGQKFKTEKAYQGHYALEHVLGLGDV